MANPEQVKRVIAMVRREIGDLIAADFQLISDVNAHLLQMQGKMFRPTLVFLVNEAVRAPDPRLVSLAAVVELIHLSTLVHDDAVDRPLRRHLRDDPGEGVPRRSARSPGERERHVLGTDAEEDAVND